MLIKSEILSHCSLELQHLRNFLYKSNDLSSHSRCVVDVGVPASVKAWFPLLLFLLNSCFLPPRLLFLLSSPPQVFLLLLSDAPPRLLQTLRGSDPFWPADFCPVQTLRTQSESWNSNSEPPSGFKLTAWWPNCFQWSLNDCHTFFSWSFTGCCFHWSVLSSDLLTSD